MSYAISTREVEETPVLVMKRKVKPQDLGQALGDMLPAVFGYATSSGAAPAGAPFVRYLDMDDEGFSIEAGIPVASPAEGQGDIHATTLPGGKVAVTVHKGPYEELSKAHEALEKWLANSHQKAAGPRWESYINDPTTVAGPSEYLTEVFAPIA